MLLHASCVGCYVSALTMKASARADHAVRAQSYDLTENARGAAALSVVCSGLLRCSGAYLQDKIRSLSMVYVL